MIIWRPSIFVGKDSTTASSCKSSFTRLSTSIPICWCAISRPRKRSVILALSPFEKANQAAEFYLIVAFICTRTEFNFLNLDNFLLFLLFLRRLALFIEEFAVIHYTTNRGSALGLISTKSTPASSAFSRASLRLTIPSCSPSRPVKRTSWARISPLIRLGRAV